MGNRPLFIVLYIIIALFEIIAEYTQNQPLVYITKPLLVVSLLLFYSTKTTHYQTGTTRKLFITGLVFALAGDIFLMIRNYDLFIPGLASFLLMQWLYIIVFRRQIKATVFSAFAMLRLIPFLTYATIFFLQISPGLADPIIRIAVGIYAISIALMGWLSLLRSKHVTHQSFLLTFSGALLFMISDSMIAIQKFLISLPLHEVLIMTTYATAQLMITLGMTKSGQAD